MDKPSIKNQLIEIHNKEAKRHLAKTKQSFRWKMGNAFARLLEIILFRKKEKLSIDFLEEHLQTIEQLLKQSPVVKKKQTQLNLLNQPTEVLFLVSDADVENSVFGDTHVANDLKLAIESINKNWRCCLANCQSDNLIEIEGNHYNLIINMFWATDIRIFDFENNIKKNTQNTLKIGWIRNYPDRWVANTSFLQYDLFLCSSKKIVDFIKQHTQNPVYLFPIAANVNRFQTNENITSGNKICFVGNRWKEVRSIESFIKNKKYPINVYGRGWDRKLFGDAAKGPIRNQQIPNIYQQSKFILDSAHQTTAEWASLNCRVFNAIATKKLLLTDSKEAVDLFKYPIPVYKDDASLENQLQHFENDQIAYQQATNYLYEELISNHTYKHRAKTLLLLLAPKLNISIKIAPKTEQQPYFGDWYFAKSLAKAFRHFGHQVQVDNYDNWFNAESQKTDLVICLRGLRAYQPLPDQINFMWLISHPDQVSVQEMEQYQHSFIASEYHYQKLKQLNLENISILLQCTDTAIFKKTSTSKNDKLLFVGNSRNVFRKSVQYALNLGYKIDVIGKDWKQFIPVKYIKAEFVPNDELYQLYNEYAIVLNDHWDDMKTQGYVSNRLFDAAACGAVILSDTPTNTDNLIPGIHYYNDQQSFKKQVEKIKSIENHHLHHYYEVNNKHTFIKRAETILLQYYNL